MRQFNHIKQLPFSSALQSHQKDAVFAQQVWEAIAPDNLIPLSKAISFHDETLFITTSHNAVAAKIKLLTPSLLEQLTQLKEKVTGIQVKVQVKSETPASSPVKREVSNKAANHLKAASKHLDNASLADILAKIASHHDKE